jgi:FMN phosphatase YigB (HAD superfamily)
VIKAVTFDVDGTLTDARALRWPMVWRNLFRLRAIRVGMQVREELRSRGDDAFADGAAMRAEEARMVGERLDKSADATRALLDDIFDRTVVACLRAQAKDARVRGALLGVVACQLKLGVVSDRRIDDKLAALGLADLPWAARVSADDTGVLKPRAQTILAAARALEVAPSEIVHVGDRADTDGAAAVNAGARFILVEGPHDLARATDEIAQMLDADPRR